MDLAKVYVLTQRIFADALSPKVTLTSVYISFQIVSDGHCPKRIECGVRDYVTQTENLKQSDLSGIAGEISSVNHSIGFSTFSKRFYLATLAFYNARNSEDPKNTALS